MKRPWDTDKSEIRVLDMPCRNVGEFQAYLNKYSASGGSDVSKHRFVEPVVYDHGPVRLRSLTPAQFGGYLLNYIHRASAYIRWQPDGAANCQTFAADLFSFLAGKRDVKPYGSVIQAAYRQRSFSFLYAPDRT